MSGLLVLIGLNGPRISDGALGFMSQVSNWLGAPRLKMRMAAFSSLPLLTAPAACSAANFDSVNPIAPSAPTCRKSRRVIPSHVVIEPFPVTLSMALPFDWLFRGSRPEEALEKICGQPLSTKPQHQILLAPVAAAPIRQTIKSA